MSRNRSNIGQGISFLDDVDYGRRPIRTNMESVEESRRTTDRMVQHNRFIFGGERLRVEQGNSHACGKGVPNQVKTRHPRKHSSILFLVSPLTHLKLLLFIKSVHGRSSPMVS
ncbi:hypothetical protein P875_00021514 [Aspergillus parasiticus SU-1]|uniref:Uncharacterized protein n=1 Tax=Aspergillus parasiticus (strain ATCC 56775 / NRRL 5862 / SRRC 143 / SU-1) TaxID=1403190 RepID=A0A0F0II14_ASPPU|nr:hypothetical protein P875_00021514 [Aspergillus parasiticus SU-1]